MAFYKKRPLLMREGPGGAGWGRVGWRAGTGWEVKPADSVSRLYDSKIDRKNVSPVTRKSDSVTRKSRKFATH